MKNTLLLILWAFYVTSSAAADNFVILGDSLSAAHGIDPEKSWTHLLEEQLSRQNPAVKLINASVSGDTSDNGLAKLPGLLKQYQPRWILVELGANDGLRGGSLSDLKSNLEQIILMSKQFHSRVFLMQIKIPPNYGRHYVSAFQAIYPKLAQKHDVILLDFLLDKVALKKELMQDDGLHPREEGQAVIYQQVWSQLNKHL